MNLKNACILAMLLVTIAFITACQAPTPADIGCITDSECGCTDDCLDAEDDMSAPRLADNIHLSITN